MLGRRGSGHPTVRPGRTPRNRETRDESERFCLTGSVVTEGFLLKVVKPRPFNVTLELTVPRYPVIFQEPGAKLRKLVRGERLDLLLDPLDLAHDPLVGALIYHPARARRKGVLLGDASH